MHHGQGLPHPEDQQRLEALQAADFDGTAWQRCAEDLAGYGFQVMVVWIRTGQVFDRMQEKNHQLRLKPPSDGRVLTEEVAEELAIETVGYAIHAFRNILRREGWSAAGGASLQTFFIGQCLFQFPNVYRRWLGETRPTPWREVEILEDLPSADDPAEQAIGQLEVEALDERTRIILTKVQEGYTQREIAVMLGVTPKVIEKLIAKFRQQHRPRGGTT
jgi:transposase